MRIDELIRGRRHLREDAQPSERIVALERGQASRRDRFSGDAVEPVASGDEVAFQRAPLASMGEPDGRPFTFEVVEGDILALEQDRPSGPEAGRDQILHHLLLPVDRDPPSPGELVERDAVTLAVEPQLDAVMNESLAG